MNFPADTNLIFPALSARLSAAIKAGDPVVTDRAIRLARNRGDHQEAERLTAEFLRITGQARTSPACVPGCLCGSYCKASAEPREIAPRDLAAALATIPLDERIGG